MRNFISRLGLVPVIVFAAGLSLAAPSAVWAQQPAGTKANPLSEGAKPASLPKCFTTDENGVVLNPNHDLPGHPYRRVYGFVVTAGGDIYNVYNKGEPATVRAEGSNAVRWGKAASAAGLGAPDRCVKRDDESKESFAQRCGANFGDEKERTIRMQHFFSVTLQLNLSGGCPTASAAHVNSPVVASMDPPVEKTAPPTKDAKSTTESGGLDYYWAMLKKGLTYKVPIPGFGASSTK